MYEISPIKINNGIIPILKGFGLCFREYIALENAGVSGKFSGEFASSKRKSTTRARENTCNNQGFVSWLVNLPPPNVPPPEIMA